MLHKCAFRIAYNRNATVRSYLFADADSVVLCSARTGSFCGSDPTQTAGNTDRSSKGGSSPFVQYTNRYKIRFTFNAHFLRDIGCVA